MGGSKQTQQTQSKTDPWAPAQPYLQDILSKAGTYANNVGMFTPEFSQNTNQGLNNIAQWAQNPLQSLEAARPLINQSSNGAMDAFGTLRDTAQGKFLNANPYLDEWLKKAGNNTANTVNQQFSAAGRYGSGAHTGVLAQKIAEQENAARMQNYGQERGNQLNAANLLSSLGFQGANLANSADQAALNQGNVLFGVGQQQDAMTMAQKQAPLAALDWQKGTTVPIAALGSNSQGTTTTTQAANPMGMILGAGMTGLGIATGNPMMAFNGAKTFGGGFGFGS